MSRLRKTVEILLYSQFIRHFPTFADKHPETDEVTTLHCLLVYKIALIYAGNLHQKGVANRLGDFVKLLPSISTDGKPVPDEQARTKCKEGDPVSIVPNNLRNGSKCTNH